MRAPLVAFLALCALVVLVSHSHSHDYGRPDLDSWFKGLSSKSAGPCCDGSDQHGLADVDWETKDGHYRVRINDVWIDVPDGAVLTEPNRAGRAMVWLYYFNGQPAARCFMPGPMI